MPQIVPVDSYPFVKSLEEVPPPPVLATRAVAGAPGSWLPFGAATPANLAALAGVTAEPATAWTSGQYVRLGDGSTAHWQGVGWARGVAGTTPPPGGGILLVDFDTPGVALEWMTGSDERARYTNAIITDIAQRYDVVIGYGHLKQWVPLMRQVNPNIQVLFYQLGPFASLGESGLTAATSWPEAEFAHTAATMVPPAWALIAEDLAGPGARHNHADLGNSRIAIMREHGGNRILTEPPFETWLMDAGDPGWQARAADRARTAVANNGTHGVLLDSMGQGAMRVGYVDGAAWNRALGAPYTPTQWNAASAEQVRIVRGSGASRIFVAINGLGAENVYDETRVIGYEADLAMSERWLRDPHNPITAFPTLAELKGSIDMLVDMEANNKVGGGVATCTKLWTTPDATVAEQQQWFELTQGAFYQGTNGNSRMFFIKDGDAPAASGGVGGSNLSVQPSPVNPGIGTPTGAYIQTGGLFRRNFTNGVALVNQGAPATVNLPAGSWRRSDTGATVTGSVTLPTNRGLVLVGV